MKTWSLVLVPIIIRNYFLWLAVIEMYYKFEKLDYGRNPSSYIRMLIYIHSFFIFDILSIPFKYTYYPSWDLEGGQGIQTLPFYECIYIHFINGAYSMLLCFNQERFPIHLVPIHNDTSLFRLLRCRYLTHQSFSQLYVDWSRARYCNANTSTTHRVEQSNWKSAWRDILTADKICHFTLTHMWLSASKWDGLRHRRIGHRGQINTKFFLQKNVPSYV